MTVLTIEKKWVIVDTNVISNTLSMGSAAPIFDVVNSCIGEFTPVITPLIRFEFLRKSNSKEEFEDFRRHLSEKYVEIELINDDDQFDTVNFGSECAVVGRFASKNHGSHIEMTDYMHHGLLRRYPKSFYMLTFDNNDFAEPIFNILCHQSVKVSDSILVWSLRNFNQEAFHKYYEIFKKVNIRKK